MYTEIFKSYYENVSYMYTPAVPPRPIRVQKLTLGCGLWVESVIFEHQNSVAIILNGEQLQNRDN